MKKTRIQTAILAVANLFLLATFIVACQKETPIPLPVQEIHNLRLQYDSTTGVRYLISNHSETTAAAAEDRGGVEGYPWSDGNCRVIFKVRNFDPTIPFGGGDGDPCPNSTILFRGYSQTNGQGTLLFSTTMDITGDWQELIIPSSAFIRFVIQPHHGSESCRFKFVLADYGWNRNAFTWYGIPFQQDLPVVTGRFAPKDPITGWFTLYDEYLCDSWCTWTVPVSFENNDPFPNSWINGHLRCYYGPNTVPTGPTWSDPRIIKDYPLIDNSSKVLYFYPIAKEQYHLYLTEANPPDNSNYIMYDVFGPDQHGAGPFWGWGVAPYLLTTTGKSCNVVPE